MKDKLGLSFSLHEDEFPLSAEHFLQSSEIFRFIVGEFESGLVLHGPLA